MSVGVWAPDAGRVELVVDGETRRMEPEAGGWWRSPEPLTPETEYAFSPDGGPPRPDPRAEHLPHGVHGPARVVDHASFTWHDAGFRPTLLREAVIYELHIGTFSDAGTFDGAIGHLDELAELGVTHVELMPVHAFPGRFGWGYDVAGFFAVHEPYGGPDGLKRLVDACHARGLAVLLDVVYNHLGPEGCYLPLFGPYVTDRFATPWGGAVNLGEAGSDEVRRFIVDNALLWLDRYHIDGLRLDAVHAFIDLTATHILEELAAAVGDLGQRQGRELVLIAESDQNDPRIVRDRTLGGHGVDAQWSDDFHHALHVTLTGERDGYYEDFEGLPDLARVLERGWAYEGRYSAHRGRRHGRTTDGLALDRFLAYSQNHDQVGNRARGDRLSHLVGTDALKVAAALVLCGPFVPMLFQGEEWGASTPFRFFADFGDQELAEAVRLGRRREFSAFGWKPEDVPDPIDPATFEASRLDRDERAQAPHADVLDWYRRLISVRASTRGLAPGARPEVRTDVGAGWLVATAGDRSVAINVSDASGGPRSIELDAGLELVAASHPQIMLESGRLTLAAMSAAVLVDRVASEPTRSRYHAP